MAAITTTEFSTVAPRGAVVAAEVFAWLLDGLRALNAPSRPETDEAVRRVTPASFPA